MKKFILAAAALAVAVIGFGGMNASTTYASPVTLWVINGNVASATATTPVTAAAFATALTTDDTTRAPYLSQLDDFDTATDGQIPITAAIPFGGQTFIVMQTDGSVTANATLDGKGLTCTPACDGVTAATPDAVDHIIVYTVTDTGTHASGDTLTVDSVQGSPQVSITSEELMVVGQARDLTLAATKTTIQEGLASCATTDSISAPTRAGAVATYVDINGTPLVGYFTDWDASGSDMLVAAPVTPSMLLSDGATVAAGNVICGVAAGSSTLTASNTVSGAIQGETTVTRTEDITITGVPASIALTASPATIACDGSATSTVTAKVTDSAGNNVVDNTNVNFSVVALGTANPINVKSTDGEASSTITPLSGSTAGVTVIVTSGDAQASIRVDCSLPVPTVAPPVASPTPGTGIVGPDTGTGGYLGQDSSAGFPMWTLVALALGSLVLVGGGMVTRRSGK